MQIGQRLLVIEPLGFGHKAFDQRENAVGAIDKAAQDFAGIRAFLAGLSK